MNNTLTGENSRPTFGQITNNKTLFFSRTSNSPEFITLKEVLPIPVFGEVWNLIPSGPHGNCSSS